MKNPSNYIIIFLFAQLVTFWSCTDTKQWKGQEALQKVDTHTIPFQKQFKGIFELGNGIYCSNDFSGARMNGAVLTDDTLVTVLITPENTPINPSPWYAFKIWSDSARSISLKLTYLEGIKHRYYPWLSHDGENWSTLDSIYYKKGKVSDADNELGFPDDITMNLFLSPDTLWISAQELITTKHVNEWTDKLAISKFVSKVPVGESKEGRIINCLKIGNNSGKIIMVLSRQHPPEVTGYLAMKSFVETLCDENKLAQQFRNTYTTYVIPLANPDGVENGHWRHNTGGVDLNRDWEDFNQKETQLIKEFSESLVSDDGKIFVAIDFHSTWQDIFYTNAPELKGNMPGLIPELIKNIGDALPGYEPNVKPRPADEVKVSSRSYFYHQFGAEALIFEIGTSTPRDFIQTKGEVAARKLMVLMMDEKYLSNI